MNKEAVIIERTQKWLMDFVIKHNICPFAKKVMVQERIAYVVNTSTDGEDLLRQLSEEMQLMERVPARKLETLLFIMPNGLTDFEDYLAFVEIAEMMLVNLELEGILQIATFHPDYRFAGTAQNDAENFTNRAPFPIIHLLREDSIAAVVDTHPNTDDIPNQNIDLMNQLGYDHLSSLKF